MVNASHELIPIKQIHLIEQGGASHLYIFGGIGLLLIFISTISYVNLVTAQGSKRALEIGIRKVIGSQRKQLIAQFLTESLFLTFLSMIIALALVILSIGLINGALGLFLDRTQLWQLPFLISFLGIFILIGFIGSIKYSPVFVVGTNSCYPCLYLCFLHLRSVVGKLRLSNGMELFCFWVRVGYITRSYVFNGRNSCLSHSQDESERKFNE